MRKNVTGIIVEVDDLVLDVTGFTRGEMLGRRSTEFMHSDDHELALTSWIQMLGKPGVPSQIQARHRTAAGRWLWVEITNTLDESDPVVIHTEMLLIDRPPVDRTSVSSRLLRHLAEALPMGIAQIDNERRVVFCNGRLADVTGQDGLEHLDDVLGAVSPADRVALDSAVESVLGGDDTEIEVSLTHPGLGLRRCGVILSALAGRSGYGTTGALLCVTDITDEAHQRAEILRRAAHDGLTGCLNRAAILDALAAAVAAGGQPDATGVAVLFFDLDRFKHINDTYGHAAGDHLLVTVAERLRRNCRDADVGRLGGDEFLVVARDVASAEQADQLGKRLVRAVRRPLNLRGTPTRPGTSVGVAWSADPAADPAGLVAAADTAMYEAKKRRRARSGTVR
jgi:diguanylate cyclase (GGDEF)-like protein